MNRDHRLSGTAAHSVWAGMHQRCYNPGSQNYDHYGGRGIRVCSRWNSLSNFLEDMGHPPPGMTIDRIDNDGDYCPENCRWATQAEQNRNTSRSRFITWQGETLTITAWGERLNLPPARISERLRRGWTVERALTTSSPVGYEEGRRKHMEVSSRLNRERGHIYRANHKRRQEQQQVGAA